MKKLLIAISIILLSASLFSQTTIFSEGFEGATNQFTSSAAVSTTANWTLNTAFSASGTQSFQGQIVTSDTLWLESAAFSTVGFPTINLSFSHIAKVDFFDKAIIQYSSDNGVTWITASSMDYLGSGNFIGNSFSSASYFDWQPGVASVTPTNSWWKSEQFNLPLLSNVTQAKIRFVIYDGDNTGSLGNYGWLVDDVEVLGSSCELIPPTVSNEIDLSGFQYTVNPLNIGIDAVDASGINSVKAFFTINSGVLDSTTLTLASGTRYSGTLPGFQVGDTVCYYYQVADNTNCLNVSVAPSASCYQFIVRATPPIPCLGTPVSNFPFVESFTTFSTNTPFTLINDWENPTNDDIDWQTRANGTPSGGTGPTGDHTTGSGNYLYIEASNVFNRSEAHLVSPCLDLTNIANGELSFWYHMLGASMGELRLDIYANNQWNLDIMSPKIGNQGANWLQETINLSAYAGQVVKFRFRGIRGNGFTSDIAIDDVGLFNIIGDDITVDSVTIASNISCQSSTLEDVNISFSNLGTTTLSTIPVAYQINNGTVVRDTFTGNLLPGNSAVFTFSQQALLVNASGSFDIVSWIELPTDIRILNDTSILTALISPTNSSYPYNESFDSFTVGNPGTFLNGWENDPTNLFDWRVGTGVTPVAGTGPSGDHTSGNGNYLFIQSQSVVGFNSQLGMISPCYDLTGLTNPEFSFWFHMYGQSMGELHLDVFANNQWNLDVISPIIGNQGDVWTSQSASLSAYIGQSIKVRFRATNIIGFLSDIAIDDISIFDVVGFDASIDSISVANSSACQLATPQPITAIIANLGSVALSSVPVAYQINNGAIVRDTFIGNIAPGSNQSFTFNQLANLSGGNGNFVVDCWTEVAADFRSQNDTLQESIQLVQTATNFPFTENFDSFTTGAPGVLFNGWTNDQSDNFDWNVNSGATGSANTGPSSDQNSINGAGNYMYLETSGGFPINATANLLSNCIDLNGVNSPELSFWYHMFGATIGELHIDLISNGVVTLDIMTPLIGNQGNQWINQTINLTQYVGQIVQVRFRGQRGTSFTGDIAIDNIEVTQSNVQTADVGVTTLLSPVFSGCQPSASQPLRVTVFNFSTIPSAITPLAYQLNNGAVVRDTLQTPLAPFGSTSFTFSTPITAQSGNNDLKIWTELSGDPLSINDTLSQQLQLNSLLSTFPAVENFDAFSVGTPGTFINGWENELVNDTHDWYVNSGNTPTAATGPIADRTSGSGNYLYVNADGFSGTSARVLSRCYDLTNANMPELDFWYHMSGSDVGKLHLDLDVNGFYVQDIIAPISGDQGVNWINRTVSLSGYPSIVRIIFRTDIITKTGTIAGDIAIDDVTISATPVGLEVLKDGFVVGEIFPNPTSEGQAKLLVNSSNESIVNTSLIDVNGRLIRQHTVGLVKGRNVISISTSELERGVYFYRLVESGRSITKKLIVQ